MAIIEIPQTQQKLNQFAAKQWDKTLAYLQGTFSMSRSDCEDIFQDAFIVLYKKITSGELALTAKLSTYFIGICRNKAYEKMRGMGKELNIIDDYPSSTKDEFEDERIDRLLALEDNIEQIEARKEAVVREIVSKLPEPCDKILWGFYRDGFSMKTLATMYNYKSEGSVKVTKHRCGEKFKSRFLELSNYLFG
jgi:RNA polymerase sigma factor (sigma-70 family)